MPHDTFQSANSIPSPPRTDLRAKIRRLPFWGWVLIATAIVLTVLHGTEIAGDQGTSNVWTMELLALAATLIVGWFVVARVRRWSLRLAVLAGFFALPPLIWGVFRLDGFTGTMLPRFALRFGWGGGSDPRGSPVGTTEPVRPEVGVDLATTTRFDFPQFLGPRRDSTVQHVTLAGDWMERPPRLLWKHEIGAGWSGFAVVNGFALTIEQSETAEVTSCYDLHTGELRWANPVPAFFKFLIAGPGPRSTPTIDQGRVYVLGATGWLSCLEGATGRPIWQRELRKVFEITKDDDAALVQYGRANSPLIVDDLVIVPVGGTIAGKRISLAAFHKQTGELAWQAGERNLSYSSPCLAELAGVRQVLIVNEDTVSGHDPKTGRVLWDFPWPGNSSQDASVSQAVPVAPDRVFLSKGYAVGAALLQLSPDGGGGLEPRELWHSPGILKTKFSNVVIDGEHVYGLSDGVLECVDLETGRRIWKEGRYGHGQILRAGNVLIVLAESGEVVLVELTAKRKNHLFGRFQAIEGKTWNTFAVSGPYLVVRNAQQAACYELPLDISSAGHEPSRPLTSPPTAARDRSPLRAP